MPNPLPTRFNPSEFEPKWQAHWEKALIFKAPTLANGAPHFTMLLPPPNVTGILTLGHSLGGTCMDVLVRMNRMKGIPTLWLPGVDHAGLATQMAVRRHLEKSGVVVSKLSRDEFLQEIDHWRVEKEEHIRRQLTAHGFSLDWSRYVYTMGEGYQRAVTTAFVRLFREGLIHRAERLVNWDPKAMTAVSDLEVIPTPEEGKLWFIRYPSTENEGQGIVVATTRPETMFGDVAVAVHPGDERYGHLVGRMLRLPLTDRTIPVISDEGVDPAFGNGALKITPSHDFADHEIAKRHPELPQRRDILDERAHLFGDMVPDSLRGLLWSEGRKKVVELLKKGNLLVKEEPYSHNVGYSERSNVPIEPRFSKQWFVDTAGMGVAALSAVKNESVKICPHRWTNTYYHFMENLEDWCISRQVIWGHRIPVWYCDGCGHLDAFEESPSRCATCGGEALHQDPDVLDTWFSSSLWPFASLGWPAEGSDQSYYPASVLVTGSDLIFFWVARMIMGGLKFKGQVPFSNVYLTGILTDRKGHKLSKSLGNSPDPLEIIEKWGADSYRFALIFPNPVDLGGFWDYDHLVEGSRNFITKLWNLVRFIASTLPTDTEPPHRPEGTPVNLFDRWLLSRIDGTVASVEMALSSYEFTRAATLLHQFVWHELADWYVEAAKERLKGLKGDQARRESTSVALYTVDRALRLLHPFIPHVTEELWHALPHTGESLDLAEWPTATNRVDEEAETRVAALQELVRGFRALRKDAGWPEGARPSGLVSPTTAVARTIVSSPEERGALLTLAKLDKLEFFTGPGKPEGLLAAVVPSGEIFIGRHGAEKGVPDSLLKEKETLEALTSKLRTRLDDPVFRSKAPEDVVNENQAKLSEMESRLKRIEQHLREVA